MSWDSRPELSSAFVAQVEEGISKAHTIDTYKKEKGRDGEREREQTDAACQTGKADAVNTHIVPAHIAQHARTIFSIHSKTQPTHRVAYPVLLLFGALPPCRPLSDACVGFSFTTIALNLLSSCLFRWSTSKAGCHARCCHLVQQSQTPCKPRLPHDNGVVAQRCGA